MNKSILVTDTPKSCSECRYGGGELNKAYYSKVPLQFDCNASGITYRTTEKLYDTKRHPKCPLQDTTELLEALHTFTEECYDREDEYGLDIDMVNSAEQLYKALGGTQ